MGRLRMVLLAPLLVCGCQSSSPQLWPRASADLGCDEKQLQVKEIRYELFEVSGCNKTETYVRSDDGSWIKESESGKEVEPTP